MDPKWKKGSRGLTPECQAAFNRIDLHWHDQRHEYASRLVERGVPLSQVRDLLGHASITTTERYDTQRLDLLQAAARKLEEGKTFQKVSSSAPETDRAPSDSREEETYKQLADRKLEIGGPRGDRTRDTVIKSHVLYH